jgi:hypothetical protein
MIKELNESKVINVMIHDDEASVMLSNRNDNAISRTSFFNFDFGSDELNEKFVKMANTLNTGEEIAKLIEEFRNSGMQATLPVKWYRTTWGGFATLIATQSASILVATQWAGITLGQAINAFAVSFLGCYVFWLIHKK